MNFSDDEEFLQDSVKLFALEKTLSGCLSSSRISRIQSIGALDLCVLKQGNLGEMRTLDLASRLQQVYVLNRAEKKTQVPYAIRYFLESVSFENLLLRVEPHCIGDNNNSNNNNKGLAVLNDFADVLVPSFSHYLSAMNQRNFSIFVSLSETIALVFQCGSSGIHDAIFSSCMDVLKSYSKNVKYASIEFFGFYKVLSSICMILNVLFSTGRFQDSIEDFITIVISIARSTDRDVRKELLFLLYSILVPSRFSSLEPVLGPVADLVIKNVGNSDFCFASLLCVHKLLSNQIGINIGINPVCAQLISSCIDGFCCCDDDLVIHLGSCILAKLSKVYPEALFFIIKSKCFAGPICASKLKHALFPCRYLGQRLANHQKQQAGTVNSNPAPTHHHHHHHHHHQHGLLEEQQQQQKVNVKPIVSFVMELNEENRHSIAELCYQCCRLCYERVSKDNYTVILQEGYGELLISSVKSIAAYLKEQGRSIPEEEVAELVRCFEENL